MKLYAISDLHLLSRVNREVLEALPAYKEDWLNVAGDIGETLELHRYTLSLLTRRFAQVIWVPGNHDLWTLPSASSSEQHERGEAKYQQLVARVTSMRCSLLKTLMPSGLASMLWSCSSRSFCYTTTAFGQMMCHKNVNFGIPWGLLILDEFGYLTLDARVGPVLYEIIASRYEKGATIITSNKSLANWGDLVGDSALMMAILDRLLHHGEVFYVRGSSYCMCGKEPVALNTKGEGILSAEKA